MLRWALRRTLEAALLTLIGALALVALVHLLPGDPLTAIAGERGLDPATEAAWRAQWKLDRSLPVILGDFLQGIFRGDLGNSFADGRPVLAVLGERIGPTLLLGGLTLLVHFTIGLMIGLWTALRPRHWTSRAVSAVTLVTYSIPSFVIGLVLVWLFAIVIPILPPAGYADPLLPSDASFATVFVDRLRHLILPLATMVLASIAVPIRQQRSAALTTANAPWVTAARARGVAPARVAWRHIWRPALSPIITLLGLWLPLLVSGAVFVEAVFAWPGLGSLIANATAMRDFPVVIGAGVLLVFTVQLGSLLADVLYHVVDPRVSEQ